MGSAEFVKRKMQMPMGIFTKNKECSYQLYSCIHKNIEAVDTLLNCSRPSSAYLNSDFEKNFIWGHSNITQPKSSTIWIPRYDLTFFKMMKTPLSTLKAKSPCLCHYK